jgi:hypothetical protein
MVESSPTTNLYSIMGGDMPLAFLSPRKGLHSLLEGAVGSH